MTTSNEYEMGRQAGILETQDARLNAIEAKIDTLIAHMEHTKGGFSILMKVGAASTAIGAGVATIIGWLIDRPHG